MIQTFNALKNTLLILVIQVPIMIALATLMAVLLNSQALKARGLFRLLLRQSSLVKSRMRLFSGSCSPTISVSSTNCLKQ